MPPSPELLPADELPEGFAYPPELLRIVRLGLVDLEPWLVLEGEPLLALHRGLRTRYPARRLVPFARRTDRDDVACWDLEPGAVPICVVGDFEVPGYEQGETHATFYGWFRSAVDDLVEWDDSSLAVPEASLLCRVCGFRDTEPPWGADGRTPSFAFCPCCGVEWGYQDSSSTGVARFREAWFAAGAPWREPAVLEDGLTTAERLRRLDPPGDGQAPG